LQLQQIKALERARKKLDLKMMYTKALTASGPEHAILSIYFFSDKKALEACLNTIGPITPEEAGSWNSLDKSVLSLEEVLVSKEANEREDLQPKESLKERIFC
jgi:hypothetical protein